MIKVKRGTGAHNTRRKQQVRQEIVGWYKQNPGSTMKDCARATGYAYQTVMRHTHEILAEQEA